MKKAYDFSKGKRGAVIPVPPGKTRITMRLDDDVLAWFRAQVHAAGGGSYQTLINSALREHMASRREDLEDTLRRVIREEWSIYEGRAGGASKPAAPPNPALQRTGRSVARR